MPLSEHTVIRQHVSIDEDLDNCNWTMHSTPNSLLLLVILIPRHRWLIHTYAHSLSLATKQCRESLWFILFKRWWSSAEIPNMLYQPLCILKAHVRTCLCLLTLVGMGCISPLVHCQQQTTAAIQQRYKCKGKSRRERWWRCLNNRTCNEHSWVTLPNNKQQSFQWWFCAKIRAINVWPSSAGQGWNITGWLRSCRSAALFFDFFPTNT